MLNKDKALRYLEEYYKSFNKSKALNKVNPNAAYKSNAQHTTRYHKAVVNNGEVMDEFAGGFKGKLRKKIPDKKVIKAIEQEINSDKFKARGIDHWLEVTGEKAPLKQEIKTVTDEKKQQLEQMADRLRVYNE